MLSILKAGPSEFTMIASLASQIWTKHYIPIIGKKQVEYMLKTIYNPTSLQEQEWAGQEFYILKDGGNPIGFISFRKEKKGIYFLHKFYIDSKKQNKGAGEKVFYRVFEKMLPAQCVRLTVNRQNYKSINFYFKLGFKIESVADFNIGKGYFMNDFIMCWKKKTDGNRN